MLFTPGACTERANLFEQYQQNALDALQLTGVKEDLGEHALALAGIVRSMYLVNFRHGNVTVPGDQRAFDNIGVLPLMASDGGTVVTSKYFANLSCAQIERLKTVCPRTADVDPLKQEVSKIFQNKMRAFDLPQKNIGLYIGSTHVAGKTDLARRRCRIKSRGIISFKPALQNYQKSAQANVVCHESDHDLFTTEVLDKHGDFYDTLGAPFATMAERRAYMVSYTILKHTGLLEGVPTAEEIAAIDSPNERRSLINSAPSFLWGVLSAVSISLANEAKDGLPTYREISQYRRAGLVGASL